MSGVAFCYGDLESAVNQILNIPEKMVKSSVSLSRSHDSSKGSSIISFPVDILDTEKEYIFYVDVPGLSKSDIQVSLEEENTLVIRSSGKRKRDEEDECKYIKLERSGVSHKFMRKFRLPENCNVSAITAKCENGVLTVVVDKLPPPPKSKTIQVTIS